MLRLRSAQVFDFALSEGNPMSKKVMCGALGAMLLALSFAAEAQQPAKIPRIGYVSGSGDPKTPGPLVEGFRQGLRDLGYIEGKNIVVEYRYVDEGVGSCPRPCCRTGATQGRCPCCHSYYQQSAQPSKRPRRFPSSWRSLPIQLWLGLSIAWRARAEISRGLPDLPES